MEKEGHNINNVLSIIRIQRFLRRYLQKKRSQEDERVKQGLSFIDNASSFNEQSINITRMFGEQQTNQSLEASTILNSDPVERSKIEQENWINLDHVQPDTPVSDVITIPYPDMKSLKKVTSLNEWRHLAGGVDIIGLRDKDPLFQKVKQMFLEHVELDKDKSVHVNKVFLIHNKRRMKDFSKYEHLYHEKRKEIDTSGFTPTQVKYLGVLSKHIYNNKDRMSNVINVWKPVPKTKKEQIASQGIRLKDELNQLYGFGLYFNTNKLSLMDQEIGSTHNMLYSNVLLGKCFPLTNVRLGGRCIENFDSHYVLGQKKQPEPSFCHNWKDFQLMQKRGVDFYPIESEDEPFNKEIIVVFDERVILPQFFLEYTVTRCKRSTRASTETFLQENEHLKKVLLVSDEDYKFKLPSCKKYYTMEEALDFGEKVMVMPGEYFSDEIMFSKKQVVEGKHKSNCILTMNGHMVVYNSISGMTIKNEDATNSENLSIFLVGDKSILHDCLIKNMNIVVEKKDAERLISQCTIVGNCSIQVLNDSVLTIQQSKIGCKRGITISNNAVCHLISNQMQCPVYVVQNSRLTAHQNTIFCHSDFAVVCSGNSNSTLKKCTFRDIRDCAIVTNGEANVSMKDCHFMECNHCINILDQTEVDIKTTTFKKSEIGVSFASKAKNHNCVIVDAVFMQVADGIRTLFQDPLIKSCKFINCERSVVTLNVSVPVIKNSVFHNSCLYLKGKSKPTLKKNQHTCDQEDSICIVMANLSQPVFKKNMVGNPKGVGIQIEQSALPNCEENTIVNSKVGLLVVPNLGVTESIHFRNNVIKHCKVGVCGGFSNSDGGKSKSKCNLVLETNKYDDNDVCLEGKDSIRIKVVNEEFLNSKTGILVRDHSQFILRNSKFINLLKGVSATDCSNFSSSKNEFIDCKLGLEFLGRTKSKLSENVVCNTTVFAECSEHSSGLIKQSDITVCETGVLLKEYANFTLKSNKFSEYVPQKSLDSGPSDSGPSKQPSGPSDSGLSDSGPSKQPSGPSDSGPSGPSKQPVGLIIKDYSRGIIESNSFHGNSGWAMELHGESVSKVLKNNFNQGFSIACYGLVDSSISENTMNDSELGFLIENCGQNVKINKNLLKNSKTDIICGSGGATIEGNTFVESSQSSIVLKDKSSAYVLNNIIQPREQNPPLSIEIRDEATCTVEKNELMNTGLSIRISGAATPTLAHNVFKGRTGIHSIELAEPTIESCNFLDSIEGIVFDDSSIGTIAKNSFVNIERAIILNTMHEEALVNEATREIDTDENGNEGARMSNDANDGARMSNDANDGARIVTDANDGARMSNDANDGARMNDIPHEKKTTRIENNKFSLLHVGIVINENAKVCIERNSFGQMIYNAEIDKPQACILALRDSHGIIERNSFFDIGIGLLFFDQSHFKVTGNSFDRVNSCGVAYMLNESETKSLNSLSLNRFENCKLGVKISSHSSPTVDKNEFRKIDQMAVLAEGSSNPCIIGNKVYTSEHRGFTFSGSSESFCSENYLENCVIGIECTDISQVTIHQNKLSDMSIGISVVNNSKVTCLANAFIGSKETAVLCADQCNVSIAESKFSKVHQKFGISAYDQAKVFVSGKASDIRDFTNEDVNDPSLVSNVETLDSRKLVPSQANVSKDPNLNSSNPLNASLDNPLNSSDNPLNSSDNPLNASVDTPLNASLDHLLKPEVANQNTTNLDETFSAQLDTSVQDTFENPNLEESKEDINQSMDDKELIELCIENQNEVQGSRDQERIVSETEQQRNQKKPVPSLPPIYASECAIFATQQAEVICRHLAIHNSSVGVLSVKNAKIILDNCELLKNKIGFVSSSRNDKSKIEFSTMKKNQRAIVFGAGSTVDCKDNDISWNKVGVTSSDASNSFVTHNKILFNFQTMDIHSGSLTGFANNKTTNALACCPFFIEKIPFFFTLILSILLFSSLVSGYSVALFILWQLSIIGGDATYWGYWASSTVNCASNFVFVFLFSLWVLILIFRGKIGMNIGLLLWSTLFVFVNLLLSGYFQFAIMVFPKNSTFEMVSYIVPMAQLLFSLIMIGICGLFGICGGMQLLDIRLFRQRSYRFVFGLSDSYRYESVPVDDDIDPTIDSLKQVETNPLSTDLIPNISTTVSESRYDDTLSAITRDELTT